MAITKYAAAAAFYDTGLIAPPGLQGSMMRCIKGTINVTVAQIDAINDTVILAPIATRARIHDIFVMSDALASTTHTMHCGLFDTDADRTAIDNDAYGNTIDMTSATAPSGVAGSIAGNIRWDSPATNITSMPMQVWEDGGLSEDPVTTWLIGLTTLSSVGTLGGNISFAIHYTLD
jgi:hypothetical protein